MCVQTDAILMQQAVEVKEQSHSTKLPALVAFKQLYLTTQLTKPTR